MSDNGEMIPGSESYDDFDHSQATIIFVLGLLSVMMCPITGPIAVFMGQKYRGMCQEADIEPEGLATAGWILGIIGTVLLFIWLAIAGVYLGIICIYIVFFIVFMLLAVLGMAL